MVRITFHYRHHSDLGRDASAGAWKTMYAADLTARAYAPLDGGWRNPGLPTGRAHKNSTSRSSCSPVLALAAGEVF